MSAKVARPSDARRAALSSATDMGEKGVPLVSNMFSLDRYYAAADTVLMAFNEAYDAGHLDDAYVYGKRFAIFSLNALPTHNYYGAPKFAKARHKNQLDMADVVHKLEQVAKWMDIEELEKEKQRRRQEAERLRREEEIARHEAEAARARLLQFQRDVFEANLQSKRSNGKNVEQSALDKLRMLQGSAPQKPYDGWEENLSDLSLKPRNDNDDYTSDLLSSFNRREAVRSQSTMRSSDSVSSTHSSASDDGMRPTQRRLSSGQMQRRGSHERESLQRRDSNERDPAQRRGSFQQEPTQRRGSYKQDQPQRRGSNEREPMQRRPSSFDREQIRRGRSREDLPLDDLPLPPPMAPPPIGGIGFPPPPSYETVAERHQRENGKHLPPVNYPPSALEQAAAHAAAASGGYRGHSSMRDPFPPLQSVGSVYANRELEKQQRAVRKERVPFRMIRQKATERFNELRAANRIQVFRLSTYQGRYSHSTNGCAVISPLVVSHHLQSRSAVSDQEIVDVIDRECGPLLREVRGKLGLGGEALIIPSDVHDYLVDKKLLHQEAFVGATGGNIMDTDHLAEFVRLVDSGEKNSHSRKRTGAALFFREHVVSIVKVPLSGGKWSYDMIDSLPGSNGMATRTRCFDLPAFEAYVRYYASAKFSESNREYIDNNDWNDMMADFDPRVFQGFVWGDR